VRYNSNGQYESLNWHKPTTTQRVCIPQPPANPAFAANNPLAGHPLAGAVGLLQVMEPSKLSAELQRRVAVLRTLQAQFHGNTTMQNSAVASSAGRQAGAGTNILQMQPMRGAQPLQVPRVGGQPSGYGNRAHMCAVADLLGIEERTLPVRTFLPWHRSHAQQSHQPGTPAGTLPSPCDTPGTLRPPHAVCACTIN
jgi:hypothetical protein